jgi:hypothetical protein
MDDGSGGAPCYSSRSPGNVAELADALLEIAGGDSGHDSHPVSISVK